MSWYYAFHCQGYHRTSFSQSCHAELSLVTVVISPKVLQGLIFDTLLFLPNKSSKLLTLTFMIVMDEKNFVWKTVYAKCFYIKTFCCTKNFWPVSFVPKIFLDQKFFELFLWSKFFGTFTQKSFLGLKLFWIQSYFGIKFFYLEFFWTTFFLELLSFCYQHFWTNILLSIFYAAT